MSARLREVHYWRYEFLGSKDIPHRGTLLTFVYDVPYFAACGIFPPFHIPNEIFATGTAGGGMSPGTRWEPFTLSEAEYASLVEAVENTPISEIKKQSRYALAPFKFDHTLDDRAARSEWVRAACEKHRERWHRYLQSARALP